MLDRSVLVRAATAACATAARAVEDSRAVRTARIVRERFTRLPPRVRVQCVVLAAVVGLAVVVWGESRLPAQQRPVLPLASGVFVALCCVALAAPFRQ
jgi:hypothetical protein